MDIESEYLGITEAAEYLRVSASTLRRWEKKKFLIPERTPTGIRRYTRQQLDDVLNAPDQGMHAHMQMPKTEDDVATEETTGSSEATSEYYDHDYYLNDAVNGSDTSANLTNIVSHRYNPPPVFENNELEINKEPTLTVFESDEEHVSVQNQLNQLANIPNLNQMTSNEVQPESYMPKEEPENNFLESVHRQNINELPSTPNLDNYLARPLTIDMSHVHFDNESFYQNVEYSSVNESESSISSPVYEQPKTRKSLRNFGMFIGIFAGFLIIAMLAWFVYSSFISGQQNDLLRPVI